MRFCSISEGTGIGYASINYLGNALVTNSTGHSRSTLLPERFTAKKVIQPFFIQGSIWAKNNVLTRTETHTVGEIFGDAKFPVFKAGGNFRKQHVAIGEVGIATSNFIQGSGLFRHQNFLVDTQVFHRDKRNQLIACNSSPSLRLRWLYLAHISQRL